MDALFAIHSWVVFGLELFASAAVLAVVAVSTLDE